MWPNQITPFELISLVALSDNRVITAFSSVILSQGKLESLPC
jgi:hypothetical protein